MSLKSKLVRTGEGGLSPEIQEYLNKMIFEVVNRSNKERDTAIANLRLEVYELRKQIDELSEKVDSLMPVAKGILIEEIESLQKKVRAIRREGLYKKFFSGDNGFLYQMPEILCGIKELGYGEAVVSEIGKFYAKNFYPVSNSVIVLDSSLENVAPEPDLSQMSSEQLMNLRDELAKLISESDDSAFPQFYSNLWNGVKDDLKRLCDPDYEEKFKHEDSLAIQEELRDTIGKIEKALVDNGIDILYSPTEDTVSGFMPAANPDLPSKPLIRRAKDKYIYAYGIINN